MQQAVSLCVVKWSRSFWSFSISDTRSLLTIYKYNIYIIVADFDNPFSILTKMTMTKMTNTTAQKSLIPPVAFRRILCLKGFRAI